MAARTDHLREYRAKRDFTSTPEPAGKPRRRKDARQPAFCVQKHLATRLHYDFRLEHDGVLLSWAVPKGPSLNPADKRLAMRTEDHPLEYGDFEGVIPEGYGAGIVVLWDKGTWKPLDGDIAAALKKGSLKFELDGVKLKGSWTLVRTGKADREAWLLMKKRDHWSGDVDITAIAPRSVKSHGDFNDILLEQKPKIWKSGTSGRSSGRSASISDEQPSEAALRKIVKRLAKLQPAESRITRKKAKTAKRTTRVRRKD